MPKLRDYRDKRTAKTTEPLGGDPPEQGEPTWRGAFVVHLHDATRLHYDLRLETGGVLTSFAVPRGPSLDPETKHLAVRTEDHPLEYLDFEDVIPEGLYGAGAMIAWDRGRVDYLEKSAEEGLAAGKVDFVLTGYKVRGRFALVRLKKGNDEWLLLKKKDAFAKPGSDLPAEQPRSVLGGLEVGELARAEELGAALEAECAAKGAPPGEVDALAVEPVEPVSVAASPRGEAWAHTLSLGGVRIVAGKHEGGAVLARGGRDVGELYPEVLRAVEALPPRGVVLDGDIVAFDDSGLPSAARLAKRLERALGGDPHGAMVDAPVTLLVSDLLAVGARDLRPLPLSARRALLTRLIPGRGVLRVNDSFDGNPTPLAAFCKEHALPGVVSRRTDAPYAPGPEGAPTTTRTLVTEAVPLRGADAPAPAAQRRVAVTNRQKVFWPTEGYTKGDLVDYYAQIAPTLLPYLEERPIAVVRYPDGIDGKSFYQWNVPPGMPRWVSSFALRDEDGPRGEKRVFIVDSPESLAYLANLACIPIHVLACKRGALDACDFLTVDFDLKGAPLPHAVAQARTLHALLGELGLEGYCKTSGQSGLHVLVPLGPGASFATAKVLAALLGQLVVRAHPDTATMERVIEKRGGKVYVDTGQTGPTRTIVAPYSVRAHAGARVSTPLAWDEVTPELDPSRFTIRTVPARVAERGDPMRSMLGARPRLTDAVSALERLVARG